MGVRYANPKVHGGQMPTRVHARRHNSHPYRHDETQQQAPQHQAQQHDATTPATRLIDEHRHLNGRARVDGC